MPSRPQRRTEQQPWILILLLIVSLWFTFQTRQPAAERPLDSSPTVPQRRVTLVETQQHETYLNLPSYHETDEFILNGGWQLTQDIYDSAAHHPGAKILSEEAPRVVVFPKFLSPEEVQHFIDLSIHELKRSEVLSASGDGRSEGNAINDIRTSFGTWPKRDDMIKHIEKRVHNLVRVPVQFGEDFYVLNYKQGQQYLAHEDHCQNDPSARADEACLAFLKRAGGPACGPGAGGPSCGDRVATFIMYLKTPTEGGLTVFPEANITKERLKGKSYSEEKENWYCNHPEEVLGIAPSPGDAVLFWNYRNGVGGDGSGSYEDGTGHPSADVVGEATHGGCPVLQGEKWIVTRWIRGSGFDWPNDKYDG